VLVPLHDGVPLRHIRRAFVTQALIVAMVGLHLLSLAGVLPAVEPALAAGFGAVPALFGGEVMLPADLPQAPLWLTPVTSLFLHANLLHLAGNMAFLYVFGDNVEDAFGHARFVVFFLLCGILATGAHLAMNLGSTSPLIGASGAISGIIGAYLLLNPHVRVWGLVFKLPLRLPAWVLLCGWAVLQVVQAFSDLGGQVAWFAHVGGLAAGLALTPLFLRPGVGLRDQWRWFRARA
jgi:membrane associated rhomboid family serine protease